MKKTSQSTSIKFKKCAESLMPLGPYLKHTHIKESDPLLLGILRILKIIGFSWYLSFKGRGEHISEEVLKEHVLRMRTYLSWLCLFQNLRNSLSAVHL